MKLKSLIFYTIFLISLCAAAYAQDLTVRTYTYDAAGRLRTVEHNNGTQVEYGFDAVNNRLWKRTVAGSATSAVLAIRGSIVSGAKIYFKPAGEQHYGFVDLSNEQGLADLPNTLNTGDTLLIVSNGYFPTYMPGNDLIMPFRSFAVPLIPNEQDNSKIVNPFFTVEGNAIVSDKSKVTLLLGGGNVTQYFISRGVDFQPLPVTNGKAELDLQPGANAITVRFVSYTDTVDISKVIYYYPLPDYYAKTWLVKLQSSVDLNGSIILMNDAFVTQLQDGQRDVRIPRTAAGKICVYKPGYSAYFATVSSDTTLNVNLVPAVAESYFDTLDFSGRKTLSFAQVTVHNTGNGKVAVKKTFSAYDTTGLRFVSPKISLKKANPSDTLSVAFIWQMPQMPQDNDLLIAVYTDGFWKKLSVDNMPSLKWDKDAGIVLLKDLDFNSDFAFGFIRKQAPVAKEPLILVRPADTVQIPVTKLFEKPDVLDDTMKVAINPVKSIQAFVKNDTITLINPEGWTDDITFDVLATYDGLTSTNQILVKTTDNPVIENIQKSVNEDDTLQFYRTDFESAFTSVNGTLDTVKIVGLPQNGKLFLRTDSVLIDINAGKEISIDSTDYLIYVPNPDYNGVDSFPYNAKDANGYALTDAYVVITVNPMNEVPRILAQTHDTTVCEYSSAELYVQADGGGLNYQWYHNFSPIGIGTDSVLKLQYVRSNDEGWYYCMVYNDIDTTYSDTLYLKVQTVPKPFIVGEDTVCQFTQGRYFVNEDFTKYSCQWSIENAELNSAADTNVITLNFNYPGTAILIYKRTDNTTQCYNSDTLTVLVKDNVQTKIVSDAEVCPGSQDNYMVLQHADSTVWYLSPVDKAVIRNSRYSDTVLVYFLDYPGDTVKIAAKQFMQNGCWDIDSIMVRINNPYSAITLTGDTVIRRGTTYTKYIAQGDEIENPDLIVSNPDAVTTFNIQTYPDIYVYWNTDFTGQLALQVQGERCGKQISSDPLIVQIVDNSTPVTDINGEKPVIYPNPFKDKFTIKLPERLIGKQLKITDITGKTVKTYDNLSTENTINLSDLPAGIYILRIEAHSYKIIKQ